MHHWTRRLFAIAAPLLLTGCLWGPGKFASDLTVRKDGSFVLDYRARSCCSCRRTTSDTQPWSDAKAKCEDNGKDRALHRSRDCRPEDRLRKEAQGTPRRWPRCSASPGLTTHSIAPSPPS